MTAILPANMDESDSGKSQNVTRFPMTSPPSRSMNVPWADAAFALLARGAAILTLSILAGIIISLVIGAWHGINEYGLRLFWSREWDKVKD